MVPAGAGVIPIIPKALGMMESGATVAAVAKELGVGKSTLTRRLTNHRLAHPERAYWWPRQKDLDLYPRRGGYRKGLKPGDHVIMVNCYEAGLDKYKNKVFTVISEPWDLCGNEVVKLEGISGGFATKFLKKVNVA